MRSCFGVLRGHETIIDYMIESSKVSAVFDPNAQSVIQIFRLQKFRILVHLDQEVQDVQGSVGAAQSKVQRD